MHNIQKISEFSDVPYHQAHHFVSDANWSHRTIMDEVANTVSGALPFRKLTGLLIDETGWVKKGIKSVGVAHQYCGNVGKTANCQVAVVAALSNGDFASLTDARLYLPQQWCTDKKRCDEAGIPQEEQVFRTKIELAAEIVTHHKGMGIGFDFVAADAFYGHDAAFARTIESQGYIYMLDIHSTQKIYEQRPEVFLPQKDKERGRKPTKLTTSVSATDVRSYCADLTEEDWQELAVRNTAKGVLKGHYHFKKVFIWDQQHTEAEQRLLVIRKTVSANGTEEIKYSFTNAGPEQYTYEAIAYMQAQRFFVEHSIKEAKEILGLDEYQTRKWTAWQHQAALNMMVSSFILKEKIGAFEDLPLLSARDVKEFIVFQLYRQMTEEQMAERILKRHQNRQMDINYAYRKQQT